MSEAAAATAPSPTTAPGPEAAAGASAPAPAPAKPTRPEGTPDKFWNDETGVDVPGLLKSYRNIEQFAAKKAPELIPDVLERLANEAVEKRRPEIEAELKTKLSKPKAPEKYELKAWKAGDEDVRLSLESEDLKAFSDFAVKAGLSQEQFQAAVEYSWHQEQARAPKAEIELAKLGEHADQRVARVADWIKANLKPDYHRAAADVAVFSEGIEMFEAIMEATGTPAFVADNSVMIGGEKVTLESLREMMKDPRYSDDRLRDRDYVAKVEAGFKKLYKGR